MRNRSKIRGKKLNPVPGLRWPREQGSLAIGVWNRDERDVRCAFGVLAFWRDG